METIDNIRSLTDELIEAAITFGVLTACLLLVILSSLLFFKRKGRRNQRLADRFFTLVSEVSLCESEAELGQVVLQSYVQEMRRTYLRKKKRRMFMNKALIAFHKSIHGVAADNIKWLYEQLGFKNDSLQKLSSRRWHKKAAAIQELAEMGQHDCITKIYRYTNHSNYYVRSAAQVAVVKLTGLDGLRFLNVLSQPITHWQQLCLLQQLPAYATIPEQKLQTWLLSKNETVVEMALKLVKHYSIFGAHDGLIACLEHSNIDIRTEAIQLLEELGNESTITVLKAHYTIAERSEKIAILRTMSAIGTIEEISFLESEIDSSDRILRNQILSTIQAIDPNWNEIEGVSVGMIHKRTVGV